MQISNENKQPGDDNQLQTYLNAILSTSIVDASHQDHVGRCFLALEKEGYACVRTGDAVLTFTDSTELKRPNIQIIQSGYTSTRELISGFDFNACCAFIHPFYGDSCVATRYAINDFNEKTATTRHGRLSNFIDSRGC